MAIRKDLYANIPNVSGIENINISESYGQTSSVATITCTETNLVLNSPITINCGYIDNHQPMFSGRVKNVTRSRAEGTIKLTCRDILIDASDMFLVADDPESPWSRSNIFAQDLVGDLLAEAQITNYYPNVPMSFTYGLNAPAEFNLVSVMDAIGQITRTLVWHVYADPTYVHFTDIKPYYRTGTQKNTEYGTSGHSDDTISHCITAGTLLSIPSSGLSPKPIIETIDYVYSDEQLRNKVKVFGRDNLMEEASETSPYLPSEFYKTAVIASPLIDSNDMASKAAWFNLRLYNRLTESLNIQCLGDSTIHARQFVEVIEAKTGVSGYWFVETANHVLGSDGYSLRLSLTK